MNNVFFRPNCLTYCILGVCLICDQRQSIIHYLFDLTVHDIDGPHILFIALVKALLKGFNVPSAGDEAILGDVLSQRELLFGDGLCIFSWSINPLL